MKPKIIALCLSGFFVTGCAPAQISDDTAQAPPEVRVADTGPVSFSPATPMPAAPTNEDRIISRVALGSCFTPYKSDDIFAQVAQQSPDLFIFMGDNVYAQDESYDPELQSLRHAYAELANAPEFARLRQDTSLMVAWDDHDYGQDDTGGDFYAKAFSERLFEHVWAVPEDDPRRQRPGTYYAKTFGPEGQRLQVIVLDTRFFATSFTRNPDPGVGRYTPSTDPQQNLLGSAQWQWLAEQLQQWPELVRH